MKQTYNFSSHWNLEEQKIYYSVDQSINFPILVSLKEYKSNVVLWSSVMESMPQHMQFWMKPGPTDEKYLNGVKLCIYNNSTGEQIYEHPFVHKFVNIPTVTLSNSAPYYVNYIEYFVDKRYDRWLNRPYSFVVDAGANVGVFSSYMLNHTNKIAAIECDVKPLEDLRRNFKHNTSVEIIPKALHSSPEPITFYRSLENPVISSTLTPDSIEAHKAGILGNAIETVDTVTLQQLVDTYGEIDLLKLDIEGAEYNVILDTDASLFDKINNMFIECHFFEKGYKKKYVAMMDKIKSLGYTVEEFRENQVDDVGATECIFATRLK